ncbi:MAG TPA: glycosyltransferase family 4 protein, partial [Pyrinomonadaceae bacterium]|nr:glycosyltransferase family 4 protein [Pyrinomonadaceae bacterium]
TITIDSLAARFTLSPLQLLRYVSSFVRQVRAARLAVKAERPDVVHANSIRAGLVMSASTFGLGMPIIWHAHDLLPRHPLSSAIRLFAWAHRRTQIVAVSNAVARSFGRLLRKNGRKVMVVHNAVDIQLFKPDDQKRNQTRKILGLPNNLVVGTVGQITPRKGQLELIKAFAQVAGDIQSAVLLIVGEALFNRDFEYAESLKSAATALGVADRVLFLGQREDAPELIRACDLLVVNSRAEPFGLTVTEAMASGTTVLATAVDGIKEIIGHGQTGWLIPSGDHDELARSLRTLLADADLRKRLSAHALSDARSRFATDRFLDEFQNIYRAVKLQQKSPPFAQAQTTAVKLSAD